MQGDDSWGGCDSVGTRSLRIGLQPVSQPNTTTLTHQFNPESVESSSDPRSSPISNVLVTSRRSLSLSARLLRYVSEQSKQGQRTVHVEIWMEKEATRVGLCRSPAPAGRNVCKWTVVRAEKQAAWCRQIGSFPRWPWQIGLPTARSTLNSCNFAVFFFKDRAKTCCVGKLKSSSFPQNNFYWKKLRFKKSSVVPNKWLNSFRTW